MFIVRIRTNFCCALRLARPGASDEENLASYGVCSQLHGHNFDVEVAVAGRLDPATGMVVNFYDLERAIREEIFGRVDHRNLNSDVDFLRGVVPTTENLAAKFWDRLEPRIKDAKLFSITIGERDTNLVTYYGPNVDFGSLAALEAAGGMRA